MIIKKKIKGITQTDMKIIQMMNKDFLPAGVKEGYLKGMGGRRSKLSTHENY